MFGLQTWLPIYLEQFAVDKAFKKDNIFEVPETLAVFCTFSYLLTEYICVPGAAAWYSLNATIRLVT